VTLSPEHIEFIIKDLHSRGIILDGFQEEVTDHVCSAVEEKMLAGIVMLLSKELCKLILIAFIIALPVAWYGVDWWLTSYSYKTEIGAGLYFLAGSLIAVIAILTMSYQSIKAAIANPVKSLRSE
jgi:hypothetical protein